MIRTFKMIKKMVKSQNVDTIVMKIEIEGTEKS